MFRLAFLLFFWNIDILCLGEAAMQYKPVDVNYKKRTIMGVDFSKAGNFEATTSSLGSAMYEGFEPTVKKLEIARDYLTNKISFAELVQLTKQKVYAE